MSRVSPLDTRLADIEADADKRAAPKRELDALTSQKNDVDAQLAKMRQVFALGTFLDTLAS